VWRARREPRAKVFGWHGDPVLIVFEAVLTKLPHYVLQRYPAIAILDRRCAGAASAVAVLACARLGLVVREPSATSLIAVGRSSDAGHRKRLRGLAVIAASMIEACSRGGCSTQNRDERR